MQRGVTVAPTSHCITSFPCIKDASEIGAATPRVCKIWVVQDAESRKPFEAEKAYIAQQASQSEA
jgi:hypothetical protein